MKFTANTPILHDGERYEEGDPIELTEKQAKALGDKVSAVAPKLTKAEQAAADKAAAEAKAEKAAAEAAEAANKTT